ncbi:hypothetical protein [Nitratifractor sp.]
MNTASIDFRFLVESDGSPLLVFNQRGHILYLNDSAEILLGYADYKELFQIALAHAPKDYGTQTVMMELHYHQLQFYAVTIAYNSEEWIAMRLYYRPRLAEEHKLDSSRLRETDLNLLLDMAIGFYRLEHQGKIRLMSDRDLPTLLTDQNNASRLLRKALESFKESETLDITLRMIPGEYILIDGQRHPVIRLSVRGNLRQRHEDRAMEELAESIGAAPYFQEDELTLDFPFIPA